MEAETSQCWKYFRSIEQVRKCKGVNFLKNPAFRFPKTSNLPSSVNHPVYINSATLCKKKLSIYLEQFYFQYPTHTNSNSNKEKSIKFSSAWCEYPHMGHSTPNESFKSSIHRHLPSFDSYSILKSLLIFTMQGSTADYRDCTFLVQLLLVSISL